MTILEYAKKVGVTKLELAAKLSISRQLLDYWIKSNYKVAEVNGELTISKVICRL